MAVQAAGCVVNYLRSIDRNAAGSGTDGRDVVRGRTSMSRRRNGTNRAGAAIGVNIYTGKLAPRKKKNLPAATGQAQELKKYSYSDYNRENRRMQG